MTQSKQCFIGVLVLCAMLAGCDLANTKQAAYGATVPAALNSLASSNGGCLAQKKALKCDDNPQAHPECPHCDPSDPSKWMPAQYNRSSDLYWCVDNDTGAKHDETVVTDLDKLDC